MGLVLLSKYTVIIEKYGEPQIEGRERRDCRLPFCQISTLPVHIDPLFFLI